MPTILNAGGGVTPGGQSVPLLSICIPSALRFGKLPCHVPVSHSEHSFGLPLLFAAQYMQSAVFSTHPHLSHRNKGISFSCNVPSNSVFQRIAISPAKFGC
jgi:hypothetical protein